MSMGFDDSAYDDLFDAIAPAEVTDEDMPWLATIAGGGSDPAGELNVAESAVEVTPVLVEPEPDEHKPSASPRDEAAPAPTPVSLQKTDHQDAVQAAAAGVRGGGGGGGDQDDVNLPRSGFRVGHESTQPNIKNVPDVLVDKMRTQLHAIVVRELGVSEVEAKGFCDRLSQGALTIAFLMAHLDVGLEVDPATDRAAVLFRRHDSLLGSVAQRVDHLQESSAMQHDLLVRTLEALRESHRTQAALEQGLAWLLAEKVEHLGKGVSAAVNLPLSHKSALDARDKLRDATGKQLRLERERDGRPIR